MKHVVRPTRPAFTIKTSDVIIEHGEPVRGVVTLEFVEYLRSRGAPADLVRSANEIAMKSQADKAIR